MFGIVFKILRKLQVKKLFYALTPPPCNKSSEMQFSL